MAEDTLELERAGDVAYLTLNRMTRGNALSSDLVDALSDVIDSQLSHGVRMLVFRGAGRHFCTGFDFSDLQTQSDADLLYRFVKIELLLQKVFNAPVMTVAIGRGRVMGAGADLFCACQRRLALPCSTYVFPGPSFGIALGTRRLTARLGAVNAQSVLIGGTVLSYADALDVRLANETSSEEELCSTLDRFAYEAKRLDGSTVQQILSATTARTEAMDLSDLVRSAARPGLGARMAEYRRISRPSQ